MPTARHSKAQGEASARTLGISPLNSHNDSLRVDGVSLEKDGIVGNDISGNIIALAAMAFRAGMP